MEEKQLLKKSGFYTFVILLGLSIFWFLFSIQNSFGYSGTGTTQDLKSGSRFNGDLLAQPLNGSVTIYFGTQSTQGTGTTGYIGTNTTGLPKLKYSYIGGSSTIDFIGFGNVKIDGSAIPSAGSVSGKIDAVGGTGTTNTFNNPTLAGLGTITASFGANGLVISPIEYSAVNNASSELQSQIDGKQASLIINSPGTITNVLGYTPPANTPGSITTSLGYTPIANVLGSITSALGYTPPANTLGSITSALGYTPTDLGSSIELGTETTGNTDNIAEGSTNKYYEDSRVNAAVGSLSVNTANDVNISMGNENDFVKIVGGQLVAGSSSATVAFPEITGSASASQIPLISGLTGSASASQIPLISGLTGSATTSQLPLNAVFVGTRSVFGTATSSNGSIVTIVGPNSPLSIYITNLSQIGTTTMLLGTTLTALMTGTSTPSPNEVVASMSYAGFDGYLAFDGHLSIGERWAAPTTTAWLRYDVGTSNTMTIARYDIACFDISAAPKTWTFEGNQTPQNDATWSVLDTETNQTVWSLNTYKTYLLPIDSISAYRSYRFNITLTNGAGDIDITEVRLIQGLSGGVNPVHVNSLGQVLIGTITANGTSSVYAFQIAGSGLATSWGVTCYEAIKSIVGSGTDVIKEGYDAVMGTKLFKHHPKLRDDITLVQAEDVAKAEYVKSFEEADYETFVTDKITDYPTYTGTETTDWVKLKEDFNALYVNPRLDEFYVLSDKDDRIKSKKIELEGSDVSITSITPVSDDPSTPDLFKRGDKRILDLEPQIGALMGATQYQAVEINELKTESDKQKIAYQAMMDAIERLGGTITVNP